MILNCIRSESAIIFKVMVLVCGLAACTGKNVVRYDSIQYNLNQDGAIGECAKLFANLDRLTTLHSVRDAADYMIAGYPFLRTNRFLASFTGIDPDSHEFQQWADLLFQKDQMARINETRNLPSGINASLLPKSGSLESSLKKIQSCGLLLKAYYLQTLEQRVTLLNSIESPSEYDVTSRVFGLYPISGLFIKMGVNRLHHKTKRIFKQTKETLNLPTRLTHYIPVQIDKLLSLPELAWIVSRSSDNPLKIPQPHTLDLTRLYDAFAPILEIETSADYDRPGAPYYKDDNLPGVDISQTTAYTKLSFVRFNDQILMQLNYIFWFTKRPKLSLLDTSSGHIDGFIWRVTLNSDGTPLLYDNIDLCGCFHQFFPSQQLQTKKDYGFYEEPPLVPQFAPFLVNSGRVVLRIQSGTHHITQVYVTREQPKGISYVFANYDSVLSLKTKSGRNKSLFDDNGIVLGSERAKRWLMWPMGIANVGSMRQWGHHATASLGQRHFDDPDLIQRNFELRR